ncbi:MAG: hypothetical protein K6F50_01830 [Kiritimatiellae bacterium]|nr:hypothetical protein [Kiritimatiellia bacterium]
MKKLLTLAAVAALSFSVCAEEEEPQEPENVNDEFAVPEEPPHKQVVAWPAFFAIHELPVTPDLVGFRITIPYSTKQENVTGFDIGLWGRAQYFEGFQLNILRNDVKDQLSGVQVGLYNTAAQADIVGVQAGLWNEAGTLHGAQAGIVNLAGQMEGFQIGLINRAEELYGIQIGVVNVIRDAEVPFCPIVNIGF